ncbi:unnamed protein product [Chilo suppressalis]|uniref:Major facilitator superfamily (MFS) profile domain-containing protein n=1 Tax=Chilo suppressalis TaxID=168631 RepID=A0ABN8BES6_CHISP|nr:unnamed protein product [Chilo suppressalis]
MEDKMLKEESKQLNGDAPNQADSDIMERIITEVGEMGTYQKLLFASLMPFFFCFIAVYCVQMFIAATPQEHWCKVPELQHLNIDLRRNLSIPGATQGRDWDRCRVYDANWTRVLETMSPPDTNDTKPCEHGWEFLYNDIPYTTVVSEREWVCDRAGNAPLAQSIFFVGSLIGCALFGWMGDKYGRLPTLIASYMIGGVGGLLTLFTQGFWDFSIARFLVGLANDSCVAMISFIVLEYVGSKHRTWVLNMSLAAFAGGGAVLLVGLALWLHNWRHLVLVTSLPMMAVLATPFFIPESARWLASKGKVDKAVKVLRKFERINKKKISEEALDQFIFSSKSTTAGPESMKDLFKNPLLRNNLLILIVVGMIANLGFDATLRLSEDIGTNFFLTFALSSAAEIPALVLVTFTLDRVGRRFMIVSTLGISSVLAIFCGFSNSGAVQLALAVLMRLAVNMSISAHLQLTTETVPTAMRASGSALVHVSVYVAITASPFIVFSGRFWSPLPLLIIGGLCFVASVLSLLLPETMGRAIPQTVLDAEQLIIDGSLWKKNKTTKHNMQSNIELATMLKKNKELT